MGECLPVQLFGGVREQLRQRGGAFCHRISSLAPPGRSCGGDPGADEVDRVSDRLDTGRLLLAHPDAVAILELHDELVEVERVRVEILAEPGLRLDLLRRHLELGAQVVSDQRHHLFAFHLSDYRLSLAGSSRSASRVAPAEARSSPVRPTAPSRTARSASLTALAMPSGVELP